jgi:hypothetical protein
MLAGLNRSSVANSLLQPILAVIAVMRGPLLKKPHHARQKTFAPVRPNRTFVLPAAVAGIHGIEIGMILDQLAHLLAREADSFVELLAVSFKKELNHSAL